MSVRTIFVNLILVFVSVIFALVLAEVLMRTFWPKYQYAVDASFEHDSTRMWSNVKGSRHDVRHPDTGESHPVIYNNYGLRQHRDIPGARLEQATTVAFFGDSYTANTRLPVQHTFPEILDYLLKESGADAEILNYGVDGYGTAQSHLLYRDAPERERLDFVFYVSCSNDFDDLFEHHLMLLDDTGSLVARSVDASPWWLVIARRLHLTYLLLDIRARAVVALGVEPEYRVSDETGLVGMRKLHDQFASKKKFVEFKERRHSELSDQIEEAILDGGAEAGEEADQIVSLYQEIVRVWNTMVREDGNEFTVVVLPGEEDDVASHHIDPSINTIRLRPWFPAEETLWRFTNDGHWDARGNRLAARILYRHLTERMGLSPRSDEWVEGKMDEFCDALSDPSSPPGCTPVSMSEEKKLRLRKTYLALE